MGPFFEGGAPLLSRSATTTNQILDSNKTTTTQQLAVSLSSATATGVGGGGLSRKHSYQPSVQQAISDMQQQNDLLSILLTRIFFTNSKNSRIGKHNVSLVLVEALYAIKGLDYLVSSKITRSNSIGTTGASAAAYQFQQRNLNNLNNSNYANTNQLSSNSVGSEISL